MKLHSWYERHFICVDCHNFTTQKCEVCHAPLCFYCAGSVFQLRGHTPGFSKCKVCKEAIDKAAKDYMRGRYIQKDGGGTMKLTVHGTLTRHLHTREETGQDVIVVGAFTLYVPATLFPVLDTLTCGDDVEATRDGDMVITLRKRG